MKFERLTRDLFADRQYSRNELNLFTSDFIGRYTKTPNAVPISAEMSILETVYQKFKAGLGELGTTSAFQKGGTISKQDAYDDALDFIRTKEGTIKGIFKKGTAAYTEFYPQGLNQYNHASVEGMKVLLVSFAATADKYKAKLGTAFITELTDLQTAYTNARDEQVGKKSDNSTTQSRLRESRKELTLQLTKCVLGIAMNTLENEAAFNSYFNFGLLEVDNDKGTGEEGI
ncbi:MAG: hypothetical protein WBP45_01085 [Daejeonella sp.]